MTAPERLTDARLPDSVRAVVSDKDDRRKILIVEEPGETGNPKLVGGNLEPGETPRTAIVREIFEETGIPEEELGSLEEIGTLPNPHDPEALRILFAVDIAGAAMRLTSATAAYEWVTRDTVPDVKHKPHIEQAIDFRDSKRTD